MIDTTYHLWSSEGLKDLDIVKMVDKYRAEGMTLERACDFTAEEIFVKLNRPKVTPHSVYNRYAYLKSGRKKKSQSQKVITAKTTVYKKADLKTKFPILSSIIKTKQGQPLNLSQFAYKLLDGQALVKAMEEVYNTQPKRVDFKVIIEELANFYGVTPKQVQNRYYHYKKVNTIKKNSDDLEKDLIKELKGRISILEKSHEQERNFHLHFREKYDSLQQQVNEKGHKIYELQRQSLIEFIKMKIKMKIESCRFIKAWRRY